MAKQTLDATIVVADPTVDIAIQSVTEAHLLDIRLTQGPHFLISPVFRARVNSTSCTCAQYCSCQLSRQHIHSAVIHQFTGLGVVKYQQFWVGSEVQYPWRSRCIVRQVLYEFIVADVQPITTTRELNGPVVSCAGIKVTMAPCTMPVAIRYVGTVTCYWHIKQRVPVSGVRVFTVETCRGTIPLCRTWRHHIDIWIMAYEGWGSMELALWYKWRGVTTAVTIQDTQCVTSAVLPVWSTAAHRSVNKTSQFLNVKISSICLQWHSRITKPPSTNHKTAARYYNVNICRHPNTTKFETLHLLTCQSWLIYRLITVVIKNFMWNL
jgi:hypothetical protein